MPRPRSKQRHTSNQSSNQSSSQHKSPPRQKLRIIAGQWRGRKLDFAEQEGLRPTPDRVRETLFNWLQVYVEGARCLDLFTGSGALALEALSRGAAHATLLDSSRAAITCLRENLAKLECDDAQVFQQDAQAWLSNNHQNEHYDLVFIDPPFHKGFIQPICEALVAQDWLAPSAHIYIEAERELQPLPAPTQWTLLKQKSTGQVCSYLYQTGNNNESR